jgi:phage baseplate assembly protein W
MSFDLKIRNGDLVIGPDADLDIVEDNEKLIQDILKMLMTPLGSNLFFPWYGSLLAGSMVGQVLDDSFRKSIVETQINNSLETLQNLQKQQSADGQRVSPGELLAAIKSIDVDRNIVDPTYYTINVKVLTKAFTLIDVPMNVTL